MDTVEITCPNQACGYTGQVNASVIGRNITCRNCNTKFTATAAQPRAEVSGATIPPASAPTPRAMRAPASALASRPPDPGDLAADQDIGPQKGPAPPLREPAADIPVIPVLARLVTIAGVVYGLWLLYQRVELRPYFGRFVLLYDQGGIVALLTSYQTLYLVLALLAVRIVWRLRRRREGPSGGIYGSAKWATDQELGRAGMLAGPGLLIGRAAAIHVSPLRALVRLLTAPLDESDAACQSFASLVSLGFIPASSGPRPIVRIPKGGYVHLMTVAPAGAGKGVGVVIPNLLTYDKSVIVIDPKGENFKITANHRRQRLNNTVLCLDPFGTTGVPAATFNPLDLIDIQSPTAIDDVKAMADALIVRTDKDTDPHWNEQAAIMVQAVILLVAFHAKEEERSLNMVRQILSSKNELLPSIKVMMASPAAGGMLARLGGQLDSLHEKEFSSVLSSANRHTNFLDSPLVAASVGHSSFRLEDIPTTKTSLFLVLPPQYLRSHARLIRLWVNCVLLALKNRGASEKDDVLFILDEVAQLGELQPLEDAVTLLRGYGVRMWFILQSLSQLKVCFPGPRAEVLQGNFGVQQFFGVNDLETAKYISSRVGKTTVTSVQTNRGSSRSWTFGSGHSEGKRSTSSSRGGGDSQGTTHVPVERDLIRPEEVLKARDCMFVFTDKTDPVMARRLSYYDDPQFAGVLSSGDSSGLFRGPGRRRTSRTSYAICLLALIFTATFLDWTGTAEAIGLRPPEPSHTSVIECSRCHRRGVIPNAYLGRRIKCTACGARLQIPLPDSPR